MEAWPLNVFVVGNDYLYQDALMSLISSGKSSPESSVPHSLSEIAARINEHHHAANTAARTALEHAVRCGELLAEAKSHVPHGQWLPWLSANVAVGVRQAQKYIRLAQQPGLALAVDTVPLTIDQALATVAKPNANRNAHLTEDTPAPEPTAKAPHGSDLESAPEPKRNRNSDLTVPAPVPEPAAKSPLGSDLFDVADTESLPECEDLAIISVIIQAEYMDDELRPYGEALKADPDALDREMGLYGAYFAARAAVDGIWAVVHHHTDDHGDRTGGYYFDSCDIAQLRLYLRIHAAQARSAMDMLRRIAAGDPSPLDDE